MKKIELKNSSDYIKQICKLFSEQCVNTNLDEYERRNQTSREKIKRDIYVGKIAEFLVFDYLINKDKKVSHPDIFIYEKEKKNFDADLTVYSEVNTNIHVKSHLLEDKFPVSWVFQKNDPLVIKPTKNDFIALCGISKDVSYMYLVKAIDVKELYRDPIKENLDKNVLYEEDIIKLK